MTTPDPLIAESRAARAELEAETNEIQAQNERLRAGLDSARTTTIDITPLLALRPLCESWAKRLAGDESPAEEAWAVFEAMHDRIVGDFIDAVLEHVIEEDPRALGRLDDDLHSLGAAITGILEPHALADEVYSEVYADRAMMRLLQVMRDRGSSVSEMSEALAEVSDEISDDGREAASQYLRVLS